MVAFFFNLIALVAKLFELLATCAAEIAEAEAELRVAEERLARTTADFEALRRCGGEVDGTNALNKKTKSLKDEIQVIQGEVDVLATSVSALRESSETLVNDARQLILDLLEAAPEGVSLRADRDKKALITVSGSSELLNVSDVSALRKAGISVYPERDVVASLAEAFELELNRPERVKHCNLSLTFDLTSGEVKKWAPKTKKKG